MNKINYLTSNSQKKSIRPLDALIDLILFLSVMFLVREIQIDSLGPWGYTLFKSFTTAESFAQPEAVMEPFVKYAKPATRIERSPS